jgi:hypothetical protein
MDSASASFGRKISTSGSISRIEAHLSSGSQFVSNEMVIFSFLHSFIQWLQPPAKPLSKK